MLLFYKPSVRFVQGHVLCVFVISDQRVFHTVRIFVLRLPECPFSILLYEADSPPIVLSDMSITIGIFPLVFNLVI